MEGITIIIYKNILEQLSAVGYTTYRLRKEKLLSERTIQRIRDGDPINTTTIDAICTLLNCQPDKILEYKKDE